jgi:heptosyltransferase-2
MAHTLLQCLAARYADLELHVVAPPATAPLAQRMAEVRTVHEIDFPHGEFGFGKRRRAGKALADHHFDLAYVLPNSWKSALLPFFAGVPQRIGWRGEARYVLLNDRRQLDKERYPLMIERFMALADDAGHLPAKPYPLPSLRTDPDNLDRCLQQLSLNADTVTALCPGAEFGAAKKWPAEHYAAVARHLLDRGEQVWLLGSPNDAADCQRIAELAPGSVNLAGQTRLLDAIDLLSVCKQVICNDSGLMHVACALGRPTIGVFGSTSPGFTPPLGEHASVVALDLDCRPCFQRTCPLGHLHCLRQLQPQMVMERLSA